MRHPKRRTTLAAAVVVCLMTACGGDDTSSPTAPTPVMPDFAGSWTGFMNLTRQTATGAWAEDSSFCESLAECDAADPVRAEITQSGRSVTATVIWEPDITFAATTGTVAGDGTVTLTWARVLPPAETGAVVDVRVQMVWTAGISGDRLTGDVELTTTADEIPGSLTGGGCLATTARECSGLQREAAP